MATDSAGRHMLNLSRVDHHVSHTHCLGVTIQRQTHIDRQELSDGRYEGS